MSNNLELILSNKVAQYLKHTIKTIGFDKWVEYPAATESFAIYWELKAIVVLKKYNIMRIKTVNGNRMVYISKKECAKTKNLLPNKAI